MSPKLKKLAAGIGGAALLSLGAATVPIVPEETTARVWFVREDGCYARYADGQEVPMDCDEYWNTAHIPNYPQPQKVERKPLLAPQKTDAAIAFDAVSTDGEVADVTSVSWSHTTGASANVLVAFALGRETSDPTDCRGVSATFNGDAMTKETESSDVTPGINTMYSTAFYRMNPDIGTFTVTVNLDGSDVCAGSSAGAMSYSGVDTACIDTSGSADGNNFESADATVTLTTATNAWIVAGAATDEPAASGITPGTDTNERFETSASTNGYNTVGGDEAPASAGSNTINWTWTGSESWAISAIAFKAAGDCAAPPPPTASSNRQHIIFFGNEDD